MTSRVSVLLACVFFVMAVAIQANRLFLGLLHPAPSVEAMLFIVAAVGGVALLAYSLIAKRRERIGSRETEPPA